MTSIDKNNPALAHDFQADLKTIDQMNAIPAILDVICRTTGMGFAAVAGVTETRWVACKVVDHIAFGLKPGEELPVDTTICHSIRQDRELVVIDNVAEDPDYSQHPTPKLYGFQSYISVPIIRRDGTVFGTLCAVDSRPARLKTPETIVMFKLFAQLIATHLENAEDLKTSQDDLKSSQDSLKSSQDNLSLSQDALHEAEANSVLREQFIAVLGHDLRNPIASIAGAARLLTKDQPEERKKMLVEGIQAATVRVAVLIDNVLDFARGRLGAGIPLEERPDVMLMPVLQGVVEELRIGVPDRVIETDFDLPTSVKCDPSRIGQLVSNLLGNALTHGTPDQPVRIHADTNDATLTIWVSNGGNPISPAALERLFQPFFRGEVRQSQQGLGLGLHIASEIAKAHGGTLKVTSTPEQTRFTFQTRLTASL